MNGFEVTVWCATPDRSFDAGWLPEADHRDLARYRRPDDRCRRTAARALLRVAVAEAIRSVPGAVPLARAACRRCGGPHGRPVVAGHPLGISVSHAGRAAVVAVVDRASVGVDIEPRRPLADAPALARRTLTGAEGEAWERCAPAERELALLAAWVRKEAVLKMTGDGLGVDPRRVHVGFGPAATATVPVPGWDGRACLRDLDLVPGHVAALATSCPPTAVTVVQVPVERLRRGEGWSADVD